MTFQKYIKDYVDFNLMGAAIVSEMSARYRHSKLIDSNVTIIVCKCWLKQLWENVGMCHLCHAVCNIQ